MMVAILLNANTKLSKYLSQLETRPNCPLRGPDFVLVQKPQLHCPYSLARAGSSRVDRAPQPLGSAD